MGFNNDLATRRPESDDPFPDVRPEDLIKFGLIPEFIGRLPMISSVSPLDRDSLIRILVEPRNALVKQFRKLFELDGVELEFTPRTRSRQLPILHCYAVRALAGCGRSWKRYC